jgi:hypothetical protein
VVKSATGKIQPRDTAGTGWAFRGVVDPKVGFALEDVEHDGHALADSIRIERIAVAGFSDNDAYRSRDDLANHHVFGLGDCKEVAAPSLEVLAKGTTDPLGYYAPRLKVAAKYEMPSLVYETDQTMELELAFLFTDYNKDPSHEPGGLIPAARIYPTLTFSIPSVGHKRKKPAYRRATAVQVLYRINLRLDDQGVGNQCGVFTDHEDLSPAGAAQAGAAGGGKPGSFTFAAAEKPVPYEIVGKGVDHGSAGGWDRTIRGWDNIHQYSHKALPGSDPNSGVSDQPYTPGLPYGGHMHWRWGESATKGAPGLPGGKQYGGPQGPGTPLIDDRIRNQNLEFAIVDLGGWFAREEGTFLTKVDQDPVSFLFQDFSRVWTDLRSTPDSLMPSANIGIWLSITAWGPGWDGVDPGYTEFSGGSGISPKDFPKVERSLSYVLPAWGGTVFPQGIFFPHETNSVFYGSWKRRIVRLIPGVNKAQYLPRFPKPKWRR